MVIATKFLSDMAKVFFILPLLQIISYSTCQDCPIDFQKDTANNICYYFGTPATDHDSAITKCKSKNSASNLPTFASQIEFDAFQSLL